MLTPAAETTLLQLQINNVRIVHVTTMLNMAKSRTRLKIYGEKYFIFIFLMYQVF